MEPSPKFFKTFGEFWFHSTGKKNFRRVGTFAGFRFSRMNAATHQNRKRPGEPGRSLVAEAVRGLETLGIVFALVAFGFPFLEALVEFFDLLLAGDFILSGSGSQGA